MRVNAYNGLIFALLVLTAAPIGEATAQARRRTSAATPAAKWIGQTGKDFIGQSFEEAPNQLQDIQIRLSGVNLEKLSNITLKGNGGGQWEWIKGEKAKSGWAIHVEPGPSPGYADLYFESDRAETGREFEIKWNSAGSPEQSLYFQGGKSDPTKPVASVSLVAAWIGQSVDKPIDLTNRSAAVGPDGFEDAVIELSNLSDRDEITAVDVETTDRKIRWSFGKNPDGAWSAELLRSPAKAKTSRLALSVPTGKDGGLTGQELKIKLTYANGGVSVTTIMAGKAAPDMAMPAPELPKMISASAKATWIGTMSKSKLGAGAVRLEISGLINKSPLTAVVVTEPSGAVYSASEKEKVVEDARPLLVDVPSSGNIRLDFLPIRDLDDVPNSVRLIFADGSNQIVSASGGKTELGQLVPEPGRGSVTAKPGDDLQSLVTRYGSVVLSDGEYMLDRTLTIDKPMRLSGASNAKVVLKFVSGERQDWSAAIKIRSGGVTLSGFSIACDASIGWNHAVAYGPAVIGTTDPLDSGFNHDTPIWGVTLQRLSIVGPDPGLPPDAKTPPEAVKLVRMTNVSLGKIESCIFRGGTVHLSGGPWTFRQNRHDGPHPGTFAWDAIAVMHPHDLLVEANRIEPLSRSGKLWRFLTLTQHGTAVQVRGNLVKNTGPKSTDKIENMNANEILLTESYRIKFEGEPAAVSSDGTVVSLPPDALADTPRPGDCLAILSGENAGKYHVVTQALGKGTLAVEPALDPKDRSINPPAVSLTNGFKQTIFDRNTIDAGGSDSAFNMVLAGNHFGTTVTGNTLIGGGESLRLTSFATESPNIWGWTHVPMFGLVVTNNTIEGAAKPGRLAVDQGDKIKTSRGRVYYSAEFTGNTLDGSDAGPAIQIGDPGTIDPASLVIDISENQAKSSDPQIFVVAGKVNGRTLKDKNIPVNTANTLRTSNRRALKR